MSELEPEALRRAREKTELSARGTFAYTSPPTRRNDPCPCDSGKKYKRCCGRTKAVRFILVHHQTGEALKERGLILVWRSRQKATTYLTRHLRYGWVVGGMGPEKWDAFQAEYSEPAPTEEDPEATQPLWSAVDE